MLEGKAHIAFVSVPSQIVILNAQVESNCIVENSLAITGFNGASVSWTDFFSRIYNYSVHHIRRNYAIVLNPGYLVQFFDSILTQFGICRNPGNYSRRTTVVVVPNDNLNWLAFYGHSEENLSSVTFGTGRRGEPNIRSLIHLILLPGVYNGSSGKPRLRGGENYSQDQYSRSNNSNNEILALPAFFFATGGFILFYKLWRKISFDFSTDINIALFVLQVFTSLGICVLGGLLFLFAFGFFPM